MQEALIFFVGTVVGCFGGMILMALMVVSGNDSSGNSTRGNNSKELDDSNGKGMM